MPIPSSINDLSTTAGSNSPPGSESPSLIDDYLRTYASYIALLRDGMQSNSFRMAAAGGTANAITATYSPAVTTFVDGMTLLVKAAAANTGSVTFSPNGLAAKPIVSTTHLALVGGEIAASGDVWLQYNSSISGGSWVLIASTGVSRIVGTVSQSGGTPTGAVIESGSNANGSYVKLADGTMMCFASGAEVPATAGVATNVSYTYPATFTVAPCGQITFRAPTSTNTFTSSQLQLTTGVGSATVRLIASVTQTYTMGIFLIGRWF